MAGVFFDSSSELATLTNVFAVDGTATDPDTVALAVTSPAGVVTAPAPTRTGTGSYKADITCNEDGTWQYEWTGTGAASDDTAGTWEVQETQLGRLYCTIDALKSRLSIDDTVDDLELHGACFAASRWLEQYCDRVFYRTASQARTFEPQGWTLLHLPAFCDLVSVTQLATDGTGDGVYETVWDPSAYQLLPQNPMAAPETRPYTEILAVAGQVFPLVFPGIRRRDRIQITGVWGWPAVPRAIKAAAQMLAAETFRRKDAPFGIAGDGAYVQTIATNQTALRMAGPYRRNPVLIG